MLQERDLEAGCGKIEEDLREEFGKLTKLWQESCKGTTWGNLLSFRQSEGLFPTLQGINDTFQDLKFTERLLERLLEKLQKETKGSHANFHDFATTITETLRDGIRFYKERKPEKLKRFKLAGDNLGDKLDKIEKLLKKCNERTQEEFSKASRRALFLWLSLACCIGGACLSTPLGQAFAMPALQQAAPDFKAFITPKTVSMSGKLLSGSGVLNLARGVKGYFKSNGRESDILEERPPKRQRM